ncbi:MAG: hypothetical protein QM500_19865 [Methylococcales bacterium]
MSLAAYPKHVEKDQAHGFEVTAPEEGYRRFILIDKSIYHFKQDLDNGDVVDEVIEVNLLDSVDKENCVRPVYGSLRTLKESCNNNSDCIEQKIAECYFKSEYLNF